MKSFVLSIFLISVIVKVNSGILNEEFTWTRLTYDLQGNNRPNRQTGQTQLTQGSGILFPGQTNDRDTHSKPNNRSDRRSRYGNQQSSNNQQSTQQNNQQSNDANGDDYIYENNIPMGANRWRNKLFITVPRRRLGVPSTLNYVFFNSTERHNVPLTPYPDYQTNRFGRPTSGQILLTSVYRVAIDPCDRMWFVDTGVVEIPGNRTQIQPSSLVIIDLNTDKIIRRHEFPESNLTPNSNLADLAVDVTVDACDSAYAYIPDVAGYGLVVYSLREDTSWRVSHNYFYLESLVGEFFIGGFHFQWNDGVFSISLTDIQPDGYRTAYFHSMAGTHIYSVSTRILRNRELATRSYHENDFKIVGDRKEMFQTAAADLHKQSGVLFWGLVNQNALGCWNTKKRFQQSNFAVIQKDDRKMIYPSDVKVAGDEIVVLTNTMPVFLYGQLDYDVTNFRVWGSSVENAISGTACEGGRGSGGGYGSSSGSGVGLENSSATSLGNNRGNNRGNDRNSSSGNNNRGNVTSGNKPGNENIRGSGGNNRVSNSRNVSGSNSGSGSTYYK